MGALDGLKERIRGTPLHDVIRGVRGLLGDKAVLYDRQTIHVMRAVLAPDSSAIDVGAHRGEILKHVLRRAPRGRHHAFEPIPAQAAYLKRHFPSVVVHEAAAGDFHGTADFHFVTNASAYSGLRPRVYDRPDPVIEILTVNVVTLDECFPGESFAFIKIDVEGGEFQVLKGATALIRRCRPVVVFEAGLKSTGMYGVSPGDLFDLVAGELGYDLTTMERWLGHRPPFSADDFEKAWREESDYYFLAAPGAPR